MLIRQCKSLEFQLSVNKCSVKSCPTGDDKWTAGEADDRTDGWTDGRTVGWRKNCAGGGFHRDTRIDRLREQSTSRRAVFEGRPLHHRKHIADLNDDLRGSQGNKRKHDSRRCFFTTFLICLFNLLSVLVTKFTGFLKST